MKGSIRVLMIFMLCVLAAPAQGQDQAVPLLKRELDDDQIGPAFGDRLESCPARRGSGTNFQIELIVDQSRQPTEHQRMLVDNQDSPCGAHNRHYQIAIS